MHATGESPSSLALNLLMLDADFVLEQSSPEIDTAFDALYQRLGPASLIP